MSSIETILKSETSAEALTSALDGQEWLFADPDLSKDSAGIRTACIKYWKVLAQLLSMFFGWSKKQLYPGLQALNAAHKGKLFAADGLRTEAWMLMQCQNHISCD